MLLSFPDWLGMSLRAMNKKIAPNMHDAISSSTIYFGSFQFILGSYNIFLE